MREHIELLFSVSLQTRDSPGRCPPVFLSALIQNITAVMSTTYACFHFGWSIEMFRAINMPSIMP